MKSDESKEIIAVVDENDKIIGKATRGEVHKKGLLHREVAVLIINQDDEILIQTRSNNGKLDYSAAGHPFYNETYLEAAVREVKEELGLEIDKSDFIKLFKHRIFTMHKDKINNRFVTVFKIQGDYKIKDINIDPAEVEKVRYYPPRELQSIMINEHDKMTNGLYNSLEIYFKTKNQKST